MAEPLSRSDAELLDLAYPCALDAVAEIERRRIEQRLEAADPAVRQAFLDTVWRMREVMARVAVLDAREPPPELEARILAALPAQPRPRPAAQWTRRRCAVTAAAAACVVLGGVMVADRTNDLPPVSSADQATRTLAGPVTGGGSVVVEVSPGLRVVRVVFDGVARPRVGQVYQVWLVPTGAAPRSAGVLDEMPSVAKPFVATFTPGEQLAISVEPPGGSKAPTNPIAGVPLF